MSQEIKEAIELLEKAVERLAIIDTISECEVRKALALLRPLLAEPCKTCRGTKRLIKFQDGQREFGGDASTSYEIPCPDCQAKKSEVGKFTTRLRKRYDGTFGMTRKDLDVVELCNIIDRQAAEYKKLEIEKGEAVAAKVQAQNDMCVLRGRHAVELRKLTEKKDGELSEIYVELELGLDHLEQALFYAVPPHPTAKERLKEAQKYLEVLRTKD